MEKSVTRFYNFSGFIWYLAKFWTYFGNILWYGWDEDKERERGIYINKRDSGMQKGWMKAQQTKKKERDVSTKNVNKLEGCEFDSCKWNRKTEDLQDRREAIICAIEIDE